MDKKHIIYIFYTFIIYIIWDRSVAIMITTLDLITERAGIYDPRFISLTYMPIQEASYNIFVRVFS